jgi:small-conductance mechanosensitive channel
VPASFWASVAALVVAGLTIALQKVVTCVAGYVSIRRGRVFTIGDRITMGGVRGDVVGMSLLRTTVMEMGQPPAVQPDEPAMWVSGRQYTGRIVTITNDKVFDTPVYNYTREFPFLWDEIRVPIRYSEDAHRAEEIALRAAADATAQIVSEARPAMQALLQAFPVIERIDIEPRVYVRLTDNWIELTVRFLARQRGVREVKNAISRQILRDLTAAGMAIASSTMDVTVKSA